MKKYFIFLILILVSFNLFSLDFSWRHPEIAEKNSIFVDVGISVFVENPELNILPLEIRIEYILPIYLPLSCGFFFHTPNPNPTSFGFRVAYHIDLRDPFLDFFFVYQFNLAFLIQDILYIYNDKPAPVYLFDYRIGFRRYFGLIGLVVETGFKLESVIIMLSLKLN